MSIMPFLVSVLAVLLITSGPSTPTEPPSHVVRPPAIAFPVTPPPNVCTVEPRDAAALMVLLGPPEPIAFPTTDSDAPDVRMIEIPVGQPVAPGVKEEVVAAIYTFFACANGGDMRRAFALGTDHFVRHYSDSGALTAEDIAFLTGEPAPVPAEFRTEIIAVTNVSVLADGRAGAFVATDDPFDDPATAYMILVRRDGRWLLDEVVDFFPR